MRFEVEADYDPSGLLGRDPSMRPGFQELRVKVEIDADLDRAGKQALLELIENAVRWPTTSLTALDWSACCSEKGS